MGISPLRSHLIFPITYRYFHLQSKQAWILQGRELPNITQEPGDKSLKEISSKHILLTLGLWLFLLRCPDDKKKKKKETAGLRVSERDCVWQTSERPER